MTDLVEIAIVVYLICALATASALSVEGEGWGATIFAFVVLVALWPALWATEIWDRVRAVLRHYVANAPNQRRTSSPAITGATARNAAPKRSDSAWL
jgi:acyl-CoA synthetase (AMP-forming)/AMP-acid ligase II